MMPLVVGMMLTPASLDAAWGNGYTPPRVSHVEIEGNTKTSQRVILNQMQIRPGDRLSHARVARAQSNLVKTGLFDGDQPPTVTVLRADPAGTTVDIRVRIKETRTGAFAITCCCNSNPGLNLTPPVRDCSESFWPTIQAATCRPNSDGAWSTLTGTTRGFAR